MDIATLVQLMAFKHPDCRVLDVGGQNSQVLLGLMPNLQLTATGTTAEDVKELQKALMEHPQVQKRQLLLCEDLEPQALKPACYDFVISHEVQNRDELRRLRTLLVTGGRLALPASSSFDDDAYNAANLTVTSLDAGKYIVGTAFETDNQGLSDGSESRNIRIVHGQRQPSILQPVVASLKKRAFVTAVSSLQDSIDPGEHIIMIAEYEEPLLSAISETDYIRLQDLLAKTGSLLWVTAGSLAAGKKPEFAMAAGLLRAMKSEQASLNVTAIDFDPDTTPLETITAVIALRAEQQVQRKIIPGTGVLGLWAEYTDQPTAAAP
ncbi:hypothetical protein P168DRAFT_135944 [Aspergillus campestris IBT 28561]|uniref:HRPKS sdrA-like NAD(P)-binding domain-containing protein n=1 Tax=Aspergillus campestris (strain IBT 28561) TaxID=1392248 RepID=A0A2I1D8C3_ASPC2|nr:uncharacterized protein P168DRAFT_135944 [Aspergillus campestris IBT 28561]PKY06131.1 hypothetical protein P168DRAFT_135944 [Aspergillus campestris IBT 28561]